MRQERGEKKGQEVKRIRGVGMKKKKKGVGRG